ncbi:MULTISPECIES: DUF58 domain-containing protein [unclassified Nocardioides]|uniref:DUF58 domain-containing protein n=1 Tax=unclassified Nocardioides TaxID=2615069 RepID=UPI0009F13922|nr:MULTISPECIES: DUF58 domain-containing protein [unclassified Nocardioides]GAW47808.1 uncharacterized protein PD653B2_0118 [Nocardioides sp. PD653-B2]GAW53558.1 uncharacterized protein PD653_0957 [Nocardioides sp. PD653]
MASPAAAWSVATARGRMTALLGLLLLVAGIGWRYPLTAGLGAVLLVVVLAEVVSVLATADVEVHREVQPSVVVRHEPCTGTLRVTGRRRRGLVRFDAMDEVDGRLVPVQLPDTAGATTVSVSYPIPTPRRGLLPVGPVHLRRYGLAGMAATSTATGRVEEVRVLPRRIPLGTMMPGHRRAPAGTDTSVEYGGTDLVGLHEYAMGDDLRRLHWATSARSGTLMVREDADPAEPHVCVLLDDRVPSYDGSTSPGELFEEAVELVAALCRAAVDRGNPLRFSSLSGRHRVVVPGSPTRHPQREARDLEWLLAEIGQTVQSTVTRDAVPGLDVTVVVTGASADRHELGLLLGGSVTRVVAVVDPMPLVSAEQHAGVTLLRGASSLSLAAAWDEAAAR